VGEESGKSRSPQSAGRGNYREAVPNGEDGMEMSTGKIATGVWESAKAKQKGRRIRAAIRGDGCLLQHTIRWHRILESASLWPEERATWNVHARKEQWAKEEHKMRVCGGRIDFAAIARRATKASTVPRTIWLRSDADFVRR